MKFLSQEIAATSHRLGVAAERLASAQAVAFRQELAHRFRLAASEQLAHERPAGAESIHDSQIWRGLADLMGENEIYLFFHPSDDPAVWRIGSGTDLVSILEDSCGFVFYAAPTDLTSLVYFDDHDCLLGIGLAAEWIAAKRTSKPPE